MLPPHGEISANDIYEEYYKIKTNINEVDISAMADLFELTPDPSIGFDQFYLKNVLRARYWGANTQIGSDFTISDAMINIIDFPGSEDAILDGSFQMQASVVNPGSYIDVSIYYDAGSNTHLLYSDRATPGNDINSNAVGFSIDVSAGSDLTMHVEYTTDGEPTGNYSGGGNVWLSQLSAVPSEWIHYIDEYAHYFYTEWQEDAYIH